MLQDLNPQNHDELVIQALPNQALANRAHSKNRRPTTVKLVDGTIHELDELSIDQLSQLQWEQETAFAELIKKSIKGSDERTEIISQAYETVCRILETASEKEGNSEFVMGMDRRYTNLVLDQLTALEDAGVKGGLFEVGFGSGVLLEAAEEEGFRVAGLEVAEQLYHEGRNRLSVENRGNLCFGNLLKNEKVDCLSGQFGLVYWNDVFEHIPVDEIECYLSKIFDLLTPGGKLITITPNWHMRPMDISSSHLPPRSSAVGFHLKEYTLKEVCFMLNRAGFKSIKTPIFVGKNRIFQDVIPGTTWLKRLVEPTLEWMPYPMAVQCCRRFGFCCTIATK